jgi:hypothetical protein
MSVPQRSRAGTLLAALFWLTVAALVGRVGLARAGDLSTANHDVGWFLHAGEAWLDGGEIGVDVIDTNPPLVLWLSGLEVALARALGLTPLVTHACLTCLVMLGGLLAAGRALARGGFRSDELACAGALVLALATIAAGYEFGQREHWLAFLLLPYAALSTVPGRWGMERWFAGLSMALAVALKPHYLVAVVVVEGLRLLDRRSWRELVRAELVVAAVGATGYLAAIQLAAPSYWKDARDTLAVYAAYDRAVPWWSVHTALALLACGAGLAAWRCGPRTCVPALFAGLALAAALAARLQHKNFAYHHLPTDVFAGTALALALVAFSRSRVRSERAEWVRTVACALVAVLALVLVPVRARDAELRGAEARVLAALEPGEGFLGFTASVGATFPAANFTPGRSFSPYSCLWLIAGNYSEAELAASEFPYRALEAMPPVERRALERIVDVLAARRPRVLYFDVRPVRQAFGRSPFEFRRYFEAHPDFARLLDEYRLLSRDTFFEYYERRD